MKMICLFSAFLLSCSSFMYLVLTETEQQVNSCTENQILTSSSTMNTFLFFLDIKLRTFEQQM